MKRITTLLLAVAFTFGSVCAAQADGIDIKVKGQWDFAFGWVNNRVFKESANTSNPGGYRPERRVKGKKLRDNDNFAARQRVRTQINFISSEYLQAVLMFEIGDLDWGRNPKGETHGRSSGGALDADGVNVETKRAYLDWIIPYTEVSVRMGIQGLALPGTRLGNPVFNADVAGIVLSSPITDWMSVTAFWIRPFDRWRNDRDAGWGRQDSLSDETDIFGLVLPLTPYKGISVSPYFLYGWAGNSSGIYDYAFNTKIDTRIQNSNAKLWYLGSNFKLDMFDPLVFNLDVIYGALQRAEIGTPESHVEAGSRGWFIAATLDYKFSWGTPGIFGWWGSGDRYSDFKDDGYLGRLPAFMNDCGSFKATSFGAHGYYGIGNGHNNDVVTGSGTGTWGIGIQAADVSFIQDLSHTLRFAYYRGTNDTDMVKKNLDVFKDGKYGWYCDGLYLTTDDSVFEVNFDHKYKIYENLTAVLELGYLHLNTDKKTWGQQGTSLKDNDDAWKAEINFRYEF